MLCDQDIVASGPHDDLEYSKRYKDIIIFIFTLKIPIENRFYKLPSLEVAECIESLI